MNNDTFTIDKIVNEDGTDFTPPIIPEYQELKDRYPECKTGFDYKCMYCDKCMYGDYFKPANEYEKQILEKQAKAYEEYLLEHNPSFRKGEMNETQNTT